jgi:hypothetical protein
MRIPKIRVRSGTGKRSFAVKTLGRNFKKRYTAWEKKKQMKVRMEGGGGQSFIYQPMIYAPFSSRMENIRYGH